jgi:hypothetical protein
LWLWLWSWCWLLGVGCFLLLLWLLILTYVNLVAPVTAGFALFLLISPPSRKLRRQHGPEHVRECQNICQIEQKECQNVRIIEYTVTTFKYSDF